MTAPADDGAVTVDPLARYTGSWRHVAIALGVWALVIAALVLWGGMTRRSLHAYAPAGPSTCTGTAVPDTTKTLATLTAQGHANTAVVFGRGLVTQTRTLEYGLDDPSTLLTGASCLDVEVSQFLRDSGDAQLNPSKIGATGKLVGNRFVLDVTVDRTADSLGRAGSYAGVISIVDPRVQRVDIPMTVTMSYPTWQFPLAVFVALLLPAIVYLWLLKGSFQGAAGSTVTVWNAVGWLMSRNGLLAVATGAVASFGSFTALYLASPTWDADPIRYVALVGGMFTAFVAAATGVAAAGVDKSSS